MGLPSSGPLSASMVRAEMSQSNISNHSFTEWASGAWSSGSSYNLNAPINVSLSQGGYFTGSVYSGMNMSKWYSYNHTTAMSLGTTASLIRAVNDYCYPSTMLVYDAGTSSMTLSITLSGSVEADTGYSVGPGLVVYYGKPWDANGYWTGSATIITGSGINWSVGTAIITANMTFNYNYTYDANKGRYLYVVYYCDNCYAP